MSITSEHKVGTSAEDLGIYLKGLTDNLPGLPEQNAPKVEDLSLLERKVRRVGLIFISLGITLPFVVAAISHLGGRVTP